MRLIECHRVLKDTGSLYLHCDPTMSHYLKLLLDCIFEEKNFKNEIIWRRKKGISTSITLSTCHDVIFFYTKSNDFTYNQQFEKYDEEYIKKTYNKQDERGKYRIHDVVASPNLGGTSPRYAYKGFIPKTRWLIKESSLLELEKNNKIIWSKNDVPYRKLYLNERKGNPLQDIWYDLNNVQGSERVGYPTQKPLKLLERIIKASTNPGDVVLDPFCGCATACVAAEKLNRQWVGIDVSEKAQELVLVRLKNEVTQTTLKDWNKKVINTGRLPVRSDLEYEELPNVEVKTLLYNEQGGVCNGCKQDFRKENLERDHILPQVKGGSDHVSNLQLLCGYCNRVKGDRPMEYLLKVLNETLQETKYCSY